ncbi:MAG: flavodoxin [Bulleidia sp.]
MKDIRKKISTLMLACVMLAGCSSSGTAASSASAAASSAPAESTAAAESAASETSASADSGKVLVVYFSATGHTGEIAQEIASDLNADTFEITPVEPYTTDDLNYSDDSSRVSREHEDENLQNQVELTTTEVPEWDSYSIVFFGYPIWWQHAAWPVNQFVQNNDFAGKTVIPFCTSASSGVGESASDLAEMAGTGNWLEGQRFARNTDASEIDAWAESQISQ